MENMTLVDYIRDKIDEKDYIFYSMVNDLLFKLDYTDHYDEEQGLISVSDRVDDVVDATHNLYDLHINKIFGYLELKTSNDANIYEKFFLLKTIVDLNDVEECVKLDLRDLFNALDRFDMLQRVYDDTASTSKHINIVEVVDEITDVFMKYLFNIIDVKESRSIEEILDEVNLKKRLKRINHDSTVYTFLLNNEVDFETSAFLLKDRLGLKYIDSTLTLLYGHSEELDINDRLSVLYNALGLTDSELEEFRKIVFKIGGVL
jgi:hypothetical protein